MTPFREPQRIPPVSPALAAAHRAEQSFNGTWQITDAFGESYRLTEIEVIHSAMHGTCLRADYEHNGRKHGRGDFRLDTAQSLEPIHEQMRMEAA